MPTTYDSTGTAYPSACHMWARANHELPYVEAARRVFAAAIDAAQTSDMVRALAELRSEWEYLNRSHDHRLSALHYVETNATEYEQQATAYAADERIAAADGDPANARAAAAARRTAETKRDAYRDAARVLTD